MSISAPAPQMEAPPPPAMARIRQLAIDQPLIMLAVAKEREVEGDVVLSDMGQGLSFRPGMFDGCLSVSALQWLMNADKSTHEPRKRTMKFFQSLYQCLARGARAVFQFYPENGEQMEMMTSCAMRAGFGGGLVVDYPNSTKAKKYFLCLFAGTPPGGYQLPKALGEGAEEAEEDDDEDHVKYESRRHERKKNHRTSVKNRDWVLAKKESQRKKGKEVRPDTKYTARKRGPKF